jgi:ATP-dependent helicase/nuclease subunit B
MKLNKPTLTGTSFIDEIVAKVLSHDAPLECAVVLPSFRAVASFKRAYARQASLPCRLPQVMTLGGFTVDETELLVADNLEVLATLYGVQLNQEGGHTGFDSFLAWGPVALEDFNSVDLNALNAAQVFKNLKDIKDIEDWSFEAEKLTEDQTRFSQQWDRLHPLYEALHAELNKRGYTTKAMMSRRLGERGATEKYTKVFAAGLTAINIAEKNYREQWRAAGKLEMVWDADVSYVADKQSEAGYFIRDFNKSRDGFEGLRDSLATTPPQVTTVYCSSVMSACQFIREQVVALSEEERHKTVIVVPDASSLPVLLQALPTQEGGYNVTMGMSLRETPVYPFMNIIQRISARGKKNWRFEELMSLVNQPVVVEAYRDSGFSEDAAKSLHVLAGQYAVWADEDLIAGVSSGPLLGLMRGLTPLLAEDAAEYLLALVHWSNDLAELLEKGKDPWIKSGWDCVRRVIAMVLRLQESHSPCKTSDDVRSLMRRLLSTQKVDLIGEPASGLQIMGLTETRALDFDRVMILDCNEGLMPKHEISDSFIPFDLKAALGIPGRHEKEATYAYSFYRLLNRSKEVHLLYKSSGGTNEGTEVSRYILQLRNTYKPGGGLLKLKNIKFSMPLPGARPEIPELKLTGKMKERLKVWSEKGMSPSAINKLVGCERNFAYRYLMQLSEQKDLKESMESNTIGSIVHFVFEEGLKEFENEILKEHHLKKILTRLDELLEAATVKYYNSNLAKKGENLILIEAARSTITKLVNKEAAELSRNKSEEVVLRGIEEVLEAKYVLDDGTEIGFFGLADRVEDVNGQKRVVDYKTGKTTQKDLNLKGDWEKTLDKGKSGKAIQLLVYCAMLLKDADGDTRVSAAIRSGRNAKAGLLKLNIDGSEDISKASIDILIDWIRGRLEILKDENHALVHNQEYLYCDYCVVLDPPYNPWA